MGAASRTRWTVLRVAFGLAGVATLVVMIRVAGADAILAALRPAWRWLPLALALEAGRIGTEAVATYCAYGTRARCLPIGMLLRAHVIAYGVGGVMPAGRAAGEATKVALLCRYVDIPTATAVAATNQAVTLLAGALISLPCGWGAFELTGLSPVTLALGVHAVVLGGAGLAIRAAARANAVGGRVSRWFSRFSLDTEAFHANSRELGLIPRGPVAAMVGGRVLQIGEYAVLAHAVGIDTGVARALYAQGINMITLALGVLVPGQIGAAEGAFAMAADALGTTVAKAMSVALLAHVLQLVWIAAGSVLLLALRSSATVADVRAPE